MKQIKRWLINWLFDGNPPLRASEVNPEFFSGIYIENNQIGDDCSIQNSHIILGIKNLYLNGENLGKVRWVITPDEIFCNN